MKSTIRAIALIMLAICYHNLAAQSTPSASRSDSLWAVWIDETRSDTDRLRAMNKYAEENYLHTFPDSLIHWADRMYELAARKDLKKYMGNALALKGVGSIKKGEIDAAVHHLDSARTLFEGIGERRDLVGVLINLGYVHQGQGNFAETIDNYTSGLRIAEEMRDSSLMARILGNIGVVYFHQGDTMNAMDYYQRRMVIAEAIGQKDILAEVLNNIAAIHQERNEYDRAIAEYERSLQLARDIGYRSVECGSLINLGVLHAQRNDYALAMDFYHRAMSIAEESGDQDGVAQSCLAIGRAYRSMDDRAQALSWGRRALAIAQGTRSIMLVRNAAELLYQVQKERGDDHEALAMHELFITMSDSVESNENKKAIMQQRFQYDYDKKEALARAEQDKKDAVATEELRRKNLQRNAFIGGFGLMVLLAGVFFVQRNRIGKEKKRSEELLLNILPAEVADELKAKGEAEARQIESVTVLFTDFKGFTAMSEMLTPKELVADIHECFSAFDHIMEKHGIEKIKTIGDAYMAAGGLPTPNSTHALDVVKAALEIRDFIAEGKAHKVAAGLPYFEIRIGIHTGPVVAGIVGVKKFAYDIWGDTVNIASRMESSGEEGQVNISEATYELVKNEPELTFTPRGKVQAKGKGEMEMYFVRRSSEVAQA